VKYTGVIVTAWPLAAMAMGFRGNETAWTIFWTSSGLSFSNAVLFNVGGRTGKPDSGLELEGTEVVISSWGLDFSPGPDWCGKRATNPRIIAIKISSPVRR